MDSGPTSWLSPRLEPRPTDAGRGVFTRTPIAAGELVAVWGGQVIDAPGFFRLAADCRRISVQIEEQLFLVPAVEGPAEWINHACAPNAGMLGQLSVVALRDLEAGEQVCYDYAMSDGSPYDEFDCGCGARTCRGRVTGNDWTLPELWVRYAGHFSPYLQRRIDRLRTTGHWQAPANPGHVAAGVRSA